MAVTSSIANLFSFFAPSPSAPPPRSPPSQLSLPSSTAAGNNTDRWAPLISSNETQPQSSPSCSSSSEIMSVMCPSLAYANTLFFKSHYNVQVIVDDDESEESLVGRFRREVLRAGIIQECKRRRYYENKQEEKKRRTRDAAKRNRRRRFPPRIGPPENSEDSNKKKEDDDDDNWDLPEGVLLPEWSS